MTRSAGISSAAGGKSAGVRIGLLEPWMCEGLADLHVRQYGGARPSAARVLQWRLLHPFARRLAILVAALDGDRPIGMQTWLPWPYRRKGRTVRAVQSGGTLVDPGYRGQRVFQRMLEFGNEVAQGAGIELYTGFPVAMSLGGFLNDGWAIVGRPRWFVAPSRPDALLRRGWARDVPEPFVLAEQGALRELPAPAVGFALSDDEEFLAWRYADAPWAPYAVLRCDRCGESTVFIVRWRVAHRVPECLLVDVRTTCTTVWSLTAALVRLRLAVLRAGRAAIVSTMVHAAKGAPIARALVAAGFLPTWKTATFMVKDLRRVPNAYDAREWAVMPRDMDTA